MYVHQNNEQYWTEGLLCVKENVLLFILLSSVALNFPAELENSGYKCFNK